MSGSSAEEVETLHRRKIDVCSSYPVLVFKVLRLSRTPGYAVYKKVGGQDQVLERWVRACQGINSSGRVVKKVMQGLGYLFQTVD